MWGGAVAALCCCTSPYAVDALLPRAQRGRKCQITDLQQLKKWHDQAELPDTGLTVPCMTEPPRRNDVIITVDQDDGHYPDPLRVRPGSPAGGIGQSCQHRDRTHGRADRQHHYS